jgi:predicted amidophosphoribosyltransferase
MNLPRLCALCDAKIKFKERLCSTCQKTYEKDLTSEWMRGIIEYSEYAFNVEARDNNRVIPLDSIARKI